VFDDDAFYIGSLMTEVLRAAGREVIHVTPDDVVGSWTTYTQEYRHVQRTLRALDVRIITAHNLIAVEPEAARLACVYSGREQRVGCASVLAITARLPNDELQGALTSREQEWPDAGIESVTAIGDCLAPGLIAHAVYSGHRYAQELGAPRSGEVPFARRASQRRMP
jgi:dimethylamine/trimethylamine dehydrogenase